MTDEYKTHKKEDGEAQSRGKPSEGLRPDALTPPATTAPLPPPAPAGPPPPPAPAAAPTPAGTPPPAPAAAPAPAPAAAPVWTPPSVQPTPPPAPPFQPAPAATSYPPPQQPTYAQPIAPQPAYYPAMPPPGYRAVPIGAPVRAGRSAGSKLLIAILALVVVAALAAALAVATGAISSRSILGLIGQGSASVTVQNLRDDPVNAVLVDTKNGQGVAGSRIGDLGSFEAGTAVASAGSYLLRIRTAQGGALADCSLTLRSGDHYLVVVIPDGTLLRRNDEEPLTLDEITADRSALCR